MKSTTKQGRLSLSVLAIGAMIGSAGIADAETYTWVPTGAGSHAWPTTSDDNWGTGVGGPYPSLAGDIANMNIDIDGNQGAQLLQDITVGTINLGDVNGSSSLNIDNGGGGPYTLTFESATAGGTTFLNLSAVVTAEDPITNTINSNILLGGTSNLQITHLGTQRLATTGTINTNGNNITLLGAAGDTSWNMSGDLVGDGTITVSGNSGINILGTKSFTGTVVLNNGIAGTSNSGSMVVTSGSLADAAEIIINGAISGGTTQMGGTFHAGNSATAGENPGQRITRHTITLNSGSITPGGQRARVGTANAWQLGQEGIYETVNLLRFNSGYSILSTSQGSNTTGTVTDTTTTARGVGGTGFMRSNGLGGSAIQVLAANFENDFDADPNNDSGYLLGAKGAGGTTTMSIIPWLGVNSGGAGTSLPTIFGTYVAGTGFRALDTSTEFTTSVTAGADHNVSTNNITLDTDDATINSLRYTAGGSDDIGDGRTLTVNSGGVWFTGNGSIGTSTPETAGTLALGAEGVFWTIGNNTNRVNALITGTQGLTKTHTGTLVLTRVNSGLSGLVNVSAGTLQVGDGTNAASVGTGGVKVHNGATLEISANVGDAILDDQTLVLDNYGLFNGKVKLAAGVIETVGTLTLGDVTYTRGYFGSTLAAAANPTLNVMVNDVFFVNEAGFTGLVQVPEPSSLALLAFGGLGLLRRRRRA